MSEDEYLELTPGQLLALADAYREQQKIEDIRVGMQLSLLANIYRDDNKKSEPFTPDDFGLPFLQEPEEIQPVKSQTLQEHALFLRVQAMNKALGGKNG